MIRDRRHVERRTPGFGAWTRALFYIVLAVLLLTGIAWLFAYYRPDLVFKWFDYSVDPGQVQSWSMKLHGAAMMIALFGTGTLLHSHLRAAWRQQRNHVSGILMVGGLCLLVISGYGLYYFSGEVREWSEWLHWIVGFGLPLMLLAHGLIGRRSR